MKQCCVQNKVDRKELIQLVKETAANSPSNKENDNDQARKYHPEAFHEIPGDITKYFILN